MWKAQWVFQICLWKWTCSRVDTQVCWCFSKGQMQAGLPSKRNRILLCFTAKGISKLYLFHLIMNKSFISSLYLKLRVKQCRNLKLCFSCIWSRLFFLLFPHIQLDQCKRALNILAQSFQLFHTYCLFYPLYPSFLSSPSTNLITLRDVWKTVGVLCQNIGSFSYRLLICWQIKINKGKNVRLA